MTFVIAASLWTMYPSEASPTTKPTDSHSPTSSPWVSTAVFGTGANGQHREVPWRLTGPLLRSSQHTPTSLWMGAPSPVPAPSRPAKQARTLPLVRHSSLWTSTRSTRWSGWRSTMSNTTTVLTRNATQSHPQNASWPSYRFLLSAGSCNIREFDIADICVMHGRVSRNWMRNFDFGWLGLGIQIFVDHPLPNLARIGMRQVGHASILWWVRKEKIGHPFQIMQGCHLDLIQEYCRWSWSTWR